MDRLQSGKGKIESDEEDLDVDYSSSEEEKQKDDEDFFSDQEDLQDVDEKEEGDEDDTELGVVSQDEEYDLEDDDLIDEEPTKKSGKSKSFDNEGFASYEDFADLLDKAADDEIQLKKESQFLKKRTFKERSPSVRENKGSKSFQFFKNSKAFGKKFGNNESINVKDKKKFKGNDKDKR